MRRKALDKILTAGGFVLALVLIAAGSLLLWGHSFANSNVHDQLAQQKIFFPAKGSKALAPADIAPYLTKYAGQQLLTGPQAKAFADHYIAVHLSEVANGQTYSQVSAKSIANPTDTKLAGQVQTLFRGETLRGLLLEAYGFWKLGAIALVAAYVAFTMAGAMLVLTAAGVWHLRSVPETATVLEKAFVGTPVTA
jgi:hypothetical protein